MLVRLSPVLVQLSALMAIATAPVAGVLAGYLGGNSKMGLLVSSGMLVVVLPTALMQRDHFSENQVRLMRGCHAATYWLATLAIIAINVLGLLLPLSHPGAVFSAILPTGIYAYVAIKSYERWAGVASASSRTAFRTGGSNRS